MRDGLFSDSLDKSEQLLFHLSSTLASTKDLSVTLRLTEIDIVMVRVLILCLHGLLHVLGSNKDGYEKACDGRENVLDEALRFLIMLKVKGRGDEVYRPGWEQAVIIRLLRAKRLVERGQIEAG